MGFGLGWWEVDGSWWFQTKGDEGQSNLKIYGFPLSKIVICSRRCLLTVRLMIFSLHFTATLTPLKTSGWNLTKNEGLVQMIFLFQPGGVTFSGGTSRWLFSVGISHNGFTGPQKSHEGADIAGGKQHYQLCGEMVDQMISSHQVTDLQWKAVTCHLVTFCLGCLRGLCLLFSLHW